MGLEVMGGFWEAMEYITSRPGPCKFWIGRDELVRCKGCGRLLVAGDEKENDSCLEETKNVDRGT